MNYKLWSVVIFSIFILLFFMLAIFKSDVTTWVWQLLLPILVFVQVYVILKAKETSTKKWENDERYDNK